MKKPIAIPKAFVCVLICIAAIVQAGDTYEEDFLSTGFRDDAATTAAWGGGHVTLGAYDVSVFGTFDTSGFSQDVAVAGDHAFLSSGSSGIRVLDISDPSMPVEVGSYDTPNQARGVAINGDYLYVANYETGLIILDISDPTAPSLVSTFPLYFISHDLTFCGDYVYVATGAGGLYIVDVSDPANPSVSGQFNAADFAYDVAVRGDRAFVVDAGGVTKGLYIIDISDPSNPTQLAHFVTAGNPFGIDIDGDYAYVADYTVGLCVFDITDTSNPQLIATYDTPGTAVDVTVSGNVVYVSNNNGGVSALDITDPSDPIEIVSLATPGQAQSIATHGYYAYVADGADGLTVLHIADAVQPTLLGGVDTASSAQRLDVAGDFAFMGNTSAGMVVFDISDPANPVQAGVFNVPNQARGVDVDGDYAYLAGYETGLFILDITDPTNPTEISRFPTYFLAHDVRACGDYAYVVTGAGGLYIIDVSDRANPALVGQYAAADFAFGIDVEGDVAYVADGGSFTQGLHVVDISDPANPTQLAYYNMTAPVFDVEVDGNYAYLANFSFGLCVLDVEDPSNPAMIVNVSTGGRAESIDVDGDLVYIANGPNSGVAVFDVSDPSSPVSLGNVPTPGSATGIAVRGSHAFVADGSQGLQVVHVNQRRWDATANVAQSLSIDARDESPRRTRLLTTESGTVNWDASADGGNTWDAVASDGQWYELTGNGTDLRWRATLGMPVGSTSPAVDDLSIEWLYDFAVIDSVTDIGNDQGGWVRVNFTRSNNDFVNHPLPISAYNIHRRIDSPATIAQISDRGHRFDGARIVRDARGENLHLTDGRAQGWIEWDGRYFQATSGVMWEVVGTVLARQDNSYIAAVPTLADGVPTVFFVSAHTTTPSEFFDSPPDSGISTDDIAPAPPTGFSVAYNTGTGNALSWSPSDANDFDYFSVYRGDNPDFVPAAENLVATTIDSDWLDTDNNGGNVHYRISTVDFGGNESETVGPETATAIGDTRLPGAYALHQNTPNPFNPTTRIAYDVPAGSGDVSLRIYDVKGRLVRTLISGAQSAGSRTVTWDGRNDSGARVSSGIYFYRLEAGSFTQTRKMTLLQ